MRAPAWHALAADAVLARLGVDAAAGLAPAEVEARRARYGRNELPAAPRRSFAAMLWSQLADFMIAVLVVAAIVSGLLGEWPDAAAILAIVVLDAALGVAQQWRTERAMAALKSLANPQARVRRAGLVSTIPAADLVAGDIVVLEAALRDADSPAHARACVRASRPSSAGISRRHRPRREPSTAKRAATGVAASWVSGLPRKRVGHSIADRVPAAGAAALFAPAPGATNAASPGHAAAARQAPTKTVRTVARPPWTEATHGTIAAGKAAGPIARCVDVGACESVFAEGRQRPAPHVGREPSARSGSTRTVRAAYSKAAPRATTSKSRIRAAARASSRCRRCPCVRR